MHHRREGKVAVPMGKVAKTHKNLFFLDMSEDVVMSHVVLCGRRGTL